MIHAMQHFESGYKMIPCVIVEDEPDAQTLLNTYCRKSGNLDVKATFFDPLSALRFLHQHTIELIFLDINLPNINGFSLLQLLPYQPKVIFTTAYSEYSLEAFDFHTVDYLLKPIRFERFLKAVGKLVPTHPYHLPDTILIGPTPGQNIKPAEVTHVEAFGNYLKVFSKGKVSVLHLTLKEITSNLEPYGFIRIHKSFLVNKAHVSSLTSSCCLLFGGEQLPVGISYRQQVLKALSR
jgi:two-component system LytT family response regulator